jgi:predicted glycosyltransferase involved in capsule biosynthesis
MINLEDVTFIIPVRIESNDRFRNLFLCCLYLLQLTNAKIIIKESDSISIVPDVIKKINSFGCQTERIKYLYEKTTEKLFHRTRLLNEMLIETETPIVVNYDCDVLLPIDSYEKAAIKCRNDCDLVYPYSFGDNVQIRMLLNEQEDVRNFILSNFDLKIVKGFLWRAEYGFCQFFKRESYIKGFMENENFLAYGPEDVERALRWAKLGYNVGRIEGKVYHMEHVRTENSSPSNPYMKANEELFEKLKTMSKEELVNYYKIQSYLKKYFTLVD